MFFVGPSSFFRNEIYLTDVVSKTLAKKHDCMYKSCSIGFLSGQGAQFFSCTLLVEKQAALHQECGAFGICGVKKNSGKVGP